MRTHDDDFVARMFVASTHTPVLFFSSLGRVYKLKVFRLPLGTPQARGRAMINMFPASVRGREHQRGDAAARGREPVGDDERVLRYGPRQGPPQRARRLHLRAEQRQDRHGPGRGRPAGRGRGLRRQPRHRPGRGGRQGDPLPGRRRAGVQVAQLRGRQRHGPRQGRRGDLDVGDRPCRGRDRGARRVPARQRRTPSSARARTAMPRRAPSWPAHARALRRTRGQGAAPADHHRQRLRQAHLGLRVPGHQPGRAGDHQHRDLGPQRPGRRHVPGRRKPIR